MFTLVLVRAKELSLTMLQKKTGVVKKLTEDHQVDHSRSVDADNLDAEFADCRGCCEFRRRDEKSHRWSRFSLSDKAVVRSELPWVMDKAVVVSRDVP